MSALAPADDELSESSDAGIVAADGGASDKGAPTAAAAAGLVAPGETGLGADAGSLPPILRSAQARRSAAVIPLRKGLAATASGLRMLATGVDGSALSSPTAPPGPAKCARY